MRSRRQFLATLGGSAVATLAGCQQLGLSGSTEPALDVPAESRVGEPFRVEVSGVPAGRQVGVEVTARDARDRRFEATFGAVASDDGVAVATAPAEDGDAGGDDGPLAAIRSEASAPERVSTGLHAGGPPRMPIATMEPTSEAVSSG